MNKAVRLQKNRDYQRVYRRGRSAAMPLVVLIYMPAPGRGKRAGFSVWKKVGKAVVRNRVRRRLKEVVRLAMPQIRGDVQMIFVARPAAAQASYAQLEQTVYKLLKRCKLLRGGE